MGFGKKAVKYSATIAFNLASRLPAAVRLLFYWRATAAARNPDREVFAKKLTREINWLKGPDRAILKNERVLQVTIEAMRESFQQGARGYAEEIRLITSTWGFALEDVEFEKVKLWYGTEDMHTPIELGRQMAKRLPKADLKEYPGDAYFSVTMNHAEEILRDLLRTD